MAGPWILWPVFKRLSRLLGREKKRSAGTDWEGPSWTAEELAAAESGADTLYEAQHSTAYFFLIVGYILGPGQIFIPL